MNPEPDTRLRLRLFVAVELPGSWLEALDQAQTRLKRDLEPAVRLRWVRPEDIHLTLKFLGSVLKDDVPALRGALDQSVFMSSQPRLQLGGLGWFASGRRLRVLWTGVTGDVEPLARLAAQIDHACVALGFATDPRPLAPHLTLARVPEGARVDVDSIEPALRGFRIGRGEGLEVKQIALIQSHLGQAGARYEVLSTFRLRSLQA